MNLTIYVLTLFWAFICGFLLGFSFPYQKKFPIAREKTEKEKRTNVHYLIQAANFAQALRYIEEAMSNTMIDYVVAAMQETQIMDIFEHNKALKKEHKPEYEKE